MGSRKLISLFGLQQSDRHDREQKFKVLTYTYNKIPIACHSGLETKDVRSIITIIIRSQGKNKVIS